MVIVPILIGTTLAWQAGVLRWWHGTLLLTWVVGYFAFNAASGALKAAARQRPRWYPAAVTYLTITTVAGLVTLGAAGWAIALWLLCFMPATAIALLLAWRRKERALAGGLLTVLAGCLMLGVARFPDPTTAIASPDLPHVLGLIVMLFGYFGGSIFYVKTLVRERGSRGWWTASVTWHAAWMALALLGVSLLGWAWVVFFGSMTLRAWYVPLLAKRAVVPIKMVGLTELANSSVAFAIALLGVPG